MVMDEALVRAALASGAQLIEESSVTGYRTDSTCATIFYETKRELRQLRARLVIGADGSTSLIARFLRGAAPPRSDRIAAVRGYFEGVSAPADRAEVYVNAAAFPGYCWLFPTGEGNANVGVGMPVEIRPPLRQPLRHVLLELIERDPMLRVRLAGARVREPIVGWPLATFNPQLPLVADRVALIGDAAGLINPLNGEGIQYALQSALWCAQALRGALSSDALSSNELAPYAARVRTEMQFDMVLARLLVDVMRNRALNSLWFAILRIITGRAARDQAYADTLCGVLAGFAPVRRLFSLRFLSDTLQQAYAATTVLK
jgi:menaquinone-9 beta-reductase